MDSGQGPLYGLHVLITEDDRDAQVIYKSILEHFGALVTVTQGVEESVATLRRSCPTWCSRT